MADHVIGTNTNTTPTTPVTTGAGTPPVVKKPDIKEIFKAGLTRSQASEYGAEALQMFDTYNKADANGNKDDVIDENEFKAYQKGELGIEDETGSNDVKGKTRTAPGGVYTVVKGDTLSKIANDFGVNLVQLYNMNKSVVGKNMNVIQIGMQLRIPSGTTATATETNPTDTDTKPTQGNQGTRPESNKDMRHILSNIMSQSKVDRPKIFAGMTRTQAEKRGAETLALFEQYAGKDAEKLDDKNFNKYKQTLSTKSPMDIMNEIPVMLGKDGKKITRKEMGVILGGLIEEGSKATGIGTSQAGQDTSNKVRDMIIKHDLYESGNPTKEEIKQHASELMQDIKASVKDEITNKGDLYKTHYDRLKEGKFTRFEIASGLQEGDELTEEQITKLTELAVKAEHIYPVLKTLSEAMQEQTDDGSKDDRIMLLIMDLGDQFFENEDVQAVAQMTGLMAVIDQAKAQFAANHIAETSSLNVENMNQEVAAMYVGTLADKADAESFQVFAENHAESIEFINQVVNKVIETTDDPNKASALRQAMDNANANVGNGGVSTSSRRTNAPPTTYSTNTIRNESERYYADLGIVTNPATVEEAERQDSHRSVNKLKSEEGPAPVVYNPARIRQLARDYNNSIGKFDTLSKEDQEAVRKYLNGAMAQPQAIISIMLSGNKEVQTFLVKEKYITMEDIYRNVKSFPSNFDSFTDTIKESLSKRTKESVNAGTLKVEQMTDGERKMYEYSNDRQG